MTQSMFRRTDCKSAQSVTTVIDLPTYRSRKSLVKLLQALEVINVLETLQPLKLAVKTTEAEKQRQFSEKMFAITGNSFYLNTATI